MHTQSLLRHDDRINGYVTTRSFVYFIICPLSPASCLLLSLITALVHGSACGVYVAQQVHF